MAGSQFAVVNLPELIAAWLTPGPFGSNSTYRSTLAPRLCAGNYQLRKHVVKHFGIPALKHARFLIGTISDPPHRGSLPKTPLNDSDAVPELGAQYLAAES